MKKLHKEWYDKYVISQKKRNGESKNEEFNKKDGKKIEEVSIAVVEKGEGFSPHCFWHEIEMPTLLKEEMKQKGKKC